MSDSTPTGAISNLVNRLPRLFRYTGPYAAELNDILRIGKTNHPKDDFSSVEKAFLVAEEAHRGQKRKSGEPYITHPLAVARILQILVSGHPRWLRHFCMTP
jgi:GTP pyrophosphokinase